MRLGETDTALIRVPIAIHDTSGVLSGGCSPTVGQLKTSVNGAAFTNAAGTLVNFGAEGYYYQGVVGDAAAEGVLCVCVEGVSGFRTEMAFQSVVGSGTTVRIPIVIYDTSGNLKAGFVPSGSELETSNDGVAFTNAPGTFTEMGFGGYLYTHSSSIGGFVMLRVASGAIQTALAFGSIEITDCPVAPPPTPTPSPPVPIPSPLVTSNPVYIDYTLLGVSRLVLQMRKP